VVTQKLSNFAIVKHNQRPLHIRMQCVNKNKRLKFYVEILAGC